MPDTPSSFAAVRPLQLHWTLGFTGKRFLSSESGDIAAAESAVASAIARAVGWLQEKARAQGALLTAVSSLARGGDSLFSRVCLDGSPHSAALPWKCLLPFEQADFLRLDLASDAHGEPLDPKEIVTRSSAALELANRAFQVSVPPHAAGFDPDVPDQRELAYLECSYATVDESDVLICLLRDTELKELLACRAQMDASGTPCPFKVGTLAAASYALAAHRPCLLLNADHPENPPLILNDPAEKNRAFFRDEDIHTIFQRVHGQETAAPVVPEDEPGIPDTSSRKSLLLTQARLDAIADHHQSRALHGLKSILSLHLLATAIAAFSATLLPPLLSAVGVMVAVILGLALVKPVLAWLAKRIEYRLHHHAERDQWLHARELAQLCRGAHAMWPLPTQPLDATDEEDFPKLKRVLRSLRIVRALDRGASAKEVPGNPGDVMSAATAYYVRRRLMDQISYYRKALSASRAQYHQWHGIFLTSIWTAIIAGVLLFVGEALEKFAGLHTADLSRGLRFLVIVAPSAATYALGMMTILDSRRRLRRYHEMQDFLQRVAATLRHCYANPSRLRLIEHAERMLIEEQHEWFSVMRNFNV